MKTLSASSRSELTTDFIVGRYRRCRETHSRCNPLNHPTPSAYPSRLLDLGASEQSLITLRSTDLFRDQEYVCLSHCWGDTKPLALNSKTHSRLAAGMGIGELPKTFQDAVVVTRSLCVRYVWIDSLYAFLVEY
jgi:hypothetical protein